MEMLNGTVGSFEFVKTRFYFCIAKFGLGYGSYVVTENLEASCGKGCHADDF